MKRLVFAVLVALAVFGQTQAQEVVNVKFTLVDSVTRVVNPDTINVQIEQKENAPTTRYSHQAVYRDSSYSVEYAVRNPDIDGNGIVGFSDFLAFAQNFGKTKSSPGFDSRLDFDKNGKVDFTDFIYFAGHYGETLSHEKTIVFNIFVEDSSFAPLSATLLAEAGQTYHLNLVVDIGLKLRRELLVSFGGIEVPPAVGLLEVTQGDSFSVAGAVLLTLNSATGEDLRQQNVGQAIRLSTGNKLRLKGQQVFADSVGVDSLVVEYADTARVVFSVLIVQGDREPPALEITENGDEMVFKASDASGFVLTSLIVANGDDKVVYDDFSEGLKASPWSNRLAISAMSFGKNVFTLSSEDKYRNATAQDYTVQVPLRGSSEISQGYVGNQGDPATQPAVWKNVVILNNRFNRQLNAVLELNGGKHDNLLVRSDAFFDIKLEGALRPIMNPYKVSVYYAGTTDLVGVLAEGFIDREPPQTELVSGVWSDNGDNDLFKATLRVSDPSGIEGEEGTSVGVVREIQFEKTHSERVVTFTAPVKDNIGNSADTELSVIQPVSNFPAPEPQPEPEPEPEPTPAPTISKDSPGDPVTMELGGTQAFSVQSGNGTVYWLVNGAQQSVTGNTFSYTPASSGTFTVRAEARGNGTASTSWTVTVSAPPPPPPSITTATVDGNGSGGARFTMTLNQSHALRSTVANGNASWWYKLSAGGDWLKIGDGENVDFTPIASLQGFADIRLLVVGSVQPDATAAWQVVFIGGGAP